MSVSGRGELERQCARLGIGVPPAILGDDDAAFFVSAVAGDSRIDHADKRTIAAAYFACREQEAVDWDDLPGWAEASGWHAKANAVLTLFHA